jgi:hypothetical protein
MHVTYEEVRGAYLVTGYNFVMFDRDLFQGIRRERHGNPEPYWSYTENRWASNCLPDEYQPSPLPLQKLALPLHEYIMLFPT